MGTITIRLDDETDAKLKQRLARSGESLSQFVRNAVRQQLDAAPAVSRTELLKRALEKIVDEGQTGDSATYKAQIREKLNARHRR